MKAIVRDDREIECDEIEEGRYGVILRDDEQGQVGYVPYENFVYAAETRTPVASSNLKSVGFDDDEGVLEIEFHSGGVYQYADVSPETYRELLSAQSRGRYFHENIRGQYDYFRIR